MVTKNQFQDVRKTGVISADWVSIIKENEESSQEGSRAHVRRSSLPKEVDHIRFCTGSSYVGKMNELGMAVHGKYKYSIGCEYEGGFEDGMFHGDGTLTYPMGQKLEGFWEKGKMVACKFTNVDGLEYEDNWQYCVMPDRRFNVSIREGLQPAGREFMTNQQPERPIEPGFYDTGDGFYNPVTRCAIVCRDPADYANIDIEESEDEEKTDDDFWAKFVKMVPDSRHDWITKHCRKGWDKPAGYRPDLYEDWITGRRAELEDLDKKYQRKISSMASLGDSESLPSSEKFSLGSGEKKPGKNLSQSTSKTDSF